MTLCESSKMTSSDWKRKIKYRILRVAATTLCLSVLSLAAAASDETYSYLTTMARSHIGEAQSAGSSDILRFTGSFNEEQWKGSGSSGFKITNRTTSRVWVYFEVTGSLRDIVRPITPVGLEPNQTYEVPLELTDAGDMGVLKWRNQGREFSGQIIARVLNNYASYHLGKVEIGSQKLFNKLFGQQIKPTIEIYGIKDVSDIINLITEKNSLIEKVAKLIDEKKQLEMANMALQNEVFSLSGSLSAANSKITQLTAPPSSSGGSTDTSGGSNGSSGNNGKTLNSSPTVNETPGGSNTGTGNSTGSSHTNKKPTGGGNPSPGNAGAGNVSSSGSTGNGGNNGNSGSTGSSGSPTSSSK